jgi:hypothetical protein
LRYYVFAVIDIRFFLLFVEVLVQSELVDKCLASTRIENIDNTCLYHLMQSDRIVTAVMEDFCYFWIHHHISQYLSCQPESLKLATLVHVPDIDKESVMAIV